MMFWRAWERYWFKPAPVFDLAVVRLIAVAFQLHHLSTIRPRSDFGPLAALPDFMWAPVLAMRILARAKNIRIAENGVLQAII